MYLSCKPDKKRKMTDIICLWIYCILSIIVITAFFCSYILDKDNNIFKPRDPDLRKCGEDEVESYPYIYFPAPFTESINSSVCVKSCPSSTSDKIDCYPNSVVKACEFKMTDHFNRNNQFIVYPTTSKKALMQRTCSCRCASPVRGSFSTPSTRKSTPTTCS